MNEERLIKELNKELDDPFTKELANTLIIRIRELQNGKQNIFGKLFLDYIRKAENGDFK